MNREADTGNDSFFFCLLLPSSFLFLLPLTSSFFLFLPLYFSSFFFLQASTPWTRLALQASTTLTGFLTAPIFCSRHAPGTAGQTRTLKRRGEERGEETTSCAVRRALYVVRCVLCAVCCVLCAVCYACIDTGATLSFFLQVPQRQPNDRKADPELRRPLRSQHGQLYLAKNVHAARVGVVPSHYGVCVVRGASERYGVRTALHGGCIRGGRGHVPELR